jgi:hypothetical protein
LQEDGELDEVYELIFDTLEKSEGDILKSSTFTSRL